METNICATTDMRQLDVIVTGVDDLDVIADAEDVVHEAFAESAVEGTWTVALRRRQAVGGWIVGVIGRYAGVSLNKHLKVESAEGLRGTMVAIFGSAARRWSSGSEAPANEVA